MFKLNQTYQTKNGDFQRTEFEIQSDSENEAYDIHLIVKRLLKSNFYYPEATFILGNQMCEITKNNIPSVKEVESLIALGSELMCVCAMDENDEERFGIYSTNGKLSLVIFFAHTDVDLKRICNVLNDTLVC